MAWLASAPIAFDGRPVPGTAWDLLSAEAGITSGLPGWREHLAVFAEELRSRLDRPGGDAAARLERARAGHRRPGCSASSSNWPDG